MNFNVSSWSIRNPTPVILLFILLTILGLYSFNAIHIQNFPDIETPTVLINTELSGATAEQLEHDVVRKIEDAVATLQGVQHIQSQISDGQANISVSFELDKNIQQAVDEVDAAVTQIRSDLPAYLNDPIVQRANMMGNTILSYTISSDKMNDEALSWFVEHQVSKALLAVKGVGGVKRIGGVHREIRVDIDPLKLMALKTTVNDISQQLKHVQQDASAGRASLGDAEQLIRTAATVKSADELAKMPIPLFDGRVVRLEQVANIDDDIAEPRSIVLLNGQAVVGFEIARAKSASETEVAKDVQAVLQKFQSQHPHIHLTKVLDFVEPVNENYQGSMMLLYEGAFLAIIVVFLFLRDWRATLISAITLPLSVIPTFLLIHWLGFSLNVVTLLSLSLVIGVLVDDAIVEIENIMRHLRMGKTPYQAAIDAANEIGLAVIATTFTLIAVFLPTAFMDGIAGQFFIQFGWTAAISVFFSLVVARMLAPMLAAYLFKVPKFKEKQPFWLSHYLKWIKICLKHRLLTMAAACTFLIGSLCLIPFLATGFMPPDDVSQTQITLTLPSGSHLEQTKAIAEQARLLLENNGYVTQVYTSIGETSAQSDPFSSSQFADVSQATLTINILPRQQRKGVTRQEIESQFRDALQPLAGVRIKVGMDDAESYVLVLAGEDSQQLNQYARQVEQDIRRIANIGTVTSTAAVVRPEIVVRPDFIRAADLGVTSAAIAETLRIATNGNYEQELAKLNLTERQIPVRVKLQAQARKNLHILENLPIPSATGFVALKNVATFSMGNSLSKIERYDRMRNINIQVELNGLALGDVEHAILSLPSLQHLPTGIVHTTTGDAEVMGELFQSFGLAMATGVLCIYMVLVLLFKGFIRPLVILIALVLSIPGALIALFITNSPLSMPSMIGLIMLMGISTKNSILLIDYILIAQHEQGLSRLEATIDACRKRARPIVMTTLAMGAGMLPIALGLGADPSFRSPMAIVVIGGLITSTILSLLVIPVVFTYLDEIEQKILVLFNKD
jgi:multidrug efflux pump subunit AcrB